MRGIKIKVKMRKRDKLVNIRHENETRLYNNFVNFSHI